MVEPRGLMPAMNKYRGEDGRNDFDALIGNWELYRHGECIVGKGVYNKAVHARWFNVLKSSVGPCTIVYVYRGVLVRSWLEKFPSPVWYRWIRMM